MASNTSTGAFGFRPLRHNDGSPWNGGTVPCYCSSSYATALYIGDPVLYSAEADEQDATARYPTIQKSAGTDGTIIRGVIVAFEPNPSNLELQYRAAGTERIAHVCMDPSVVYQIRGDGGGTPADTWIGMNANCIATTAGSTITGLSGMQLDEGTTDGPEVNQSNPLLIVGTTQLPDETALNDYTLWEVQLNTYWNATGSVLGVSGS
jgi:hypothetical protein